MILKIFCARGLDHLQYCLFEITIALTPTYIIYVYKMFQGKKVNILRSDGISNFKQTYSYECISFFQMISEISDQKYS